NPARIVRELDPEKEMITRKDRYSDTEKMNRVLDASEKEFLDGNTLWGWLRTFVAPKKELP
ncbi:MAG TPA: acetyltransferase, partial [Desulfobacteraceae bacterium]|nr:acetyltransferase [Desulfobacteraceae bacterium]